MNSEVAEQNMLHKVQRILHVCGTRHVMFPGRCLVQKSMTRNLRYLQIVGFELTLSLLVI